MCNALSIATVTAALGQIVDGAAKSAVDGASLTMARPGDENHLPPQRVHLYLYQVTPSDAPRNAHQPIGTGSDGTVQRPPAAVDLSYLLAFYGNPAEHEPERMLAAVVRDLHAHPLLTRDDILTAIANHSGILGASTLADAEEPVKITPSPLTFEDMSRLWSVFFQARHTLSVAYQASSVTIDACTCR